VSHRGLGNVADQFREVAAAEDVKGLDPTPAAGASCPQGRAGSAGVARARGAASGGDFLSRAYELYARDIYRFFLSRTSDTNAAEDLTQDVFVAAVAAQSILSLDDRSLAPWLFVVARRRYVDEIRWRAHHPSCLPLTEAAALAAKQENEGCEVQALLEAMVSLPPAQSKTCILRLLEGRSFDDIATELCTTSDACRRRFARAMTTLRNQLTRADLVDTVALFALALSDF
jgi:RNA polymerase sigma-70 factor (ECF subfamily)